jgi:hypothetical protein
MACLPASLLASAWLSWASFDDEWEARRFFQHYFHDDDAMVRLRGALACDLYPLTRWSDAQVLSTAALRLARGDWQVAYEDLAAAAAGAAVTAGPAPVRRSMPVRQEAPPRPDPAPGRLPPLRRMPSQQEAPPVDIPKSAPAEWSKSAADQIAQAETLETAARDGTPFCAICEAMRKAKLEAQDA